MIVNVPGIVLSRHDFREADQLATLYTESLGKLSVRFVGVKKPGRKLKALSEPMVWGEYRLYMSPRSEMGKAVGGRLIGSFPSVRERLDVTLQAMSCCEMLDKLAPAHLPNADKYRLLCGALEALEQAPHPWISIAFGFQLLELSGYGLSAVLGNEDPRLWRALHERPLRELAALSCASEALPRLRRRLVDHVEAQTGRPLRAPALMESLGRSALAC